MKMNEEKEFRIFQKMNEIEKLIKLKFISFEKTAKFKIDKDGIYIITKGYFNITEPIKLFDELEKLDGRKVKSIKIKNFGNKTVTFICFKLCKTLNDNPFGAGVLEDDETILQELKRNKLKEMNEGRIRFINKLEKMKEKNRKKLFGNVDMNVLKMEIK